MRVAVHVTERVFHAWPSSYWAEFLRKATAAGHDVYVFSDDDCISFETQNPKVYNLIGLSDAEERQGMKDCDVFVGPKLRYYDMAVELGVRTVGLLGATLEGDGVKSPHPCAGCLDKLENQVDCFFGDEVCLLEVTPNMVLAAL